MPSLPLFDPIDYLVRRKYPSPLSAMAKKYGPPLDSGQKARLTLAEALVKGPEIEAYRQELNTKSPEEIDALVFEESEKQRGEQRLAAELEEKRQIFNRDEATTVDYAHYAKMVLWSIEEAVALSLGRNPKVVSWDSIRIKRHSPFVERYGNRQELVRRANIPWHQTPTGSHVKPSDFYTWAKRYEVEIPADLEKQLKAFANAVDWQVACLGYFNENKELKTSITELEAAAKGKKSDAKSLSTTERNTLLKMLYAMAKVEYGFTRGLKGTAASDIEKAATTVGLKIDADTARKWLNTAADYCKGLETE